MFTSVPEAFAVICCIWRQISKSCTGLFSRLISDTDCCGCQIRLHIIAMHELCEYTKGEGFSEGFDAHLNIEQMNKTSVELFQVYDDHRKKGINIPTEKEFRGYYALLKLDKHPGYKVSH